MMKKFITEKYPQFDVPSHEKNVLHIKTAGIAIIGDYHFPFFSTEFFERFVAFAKKMGVHDWLHAGDILDWPYLNNHPKTSAGYGLPTPKDAVQGWHKMTDQLLRDGFNRQFVLYGTHDFRVSFKTEGQITPDMFDREYLISSPYGLAFVEDGYRTAVVVHPGEYSKIPGRVANNYALAYSMDAICAHSHTSSFGQADNGHFIYDIGGSYLEGAIEYLYVRPNASRRRMLGGLVMKDGQYFPFFQENDREI